MTQRRECRRYADDLSGFVDQRLGTRRLMQVSEHLIRCPQCRAQVEDLRAVRQRLSSCRRSADLSASLAARLQGIAGEERDEPLYLSTAKLRARRRSPLAAGAFFTSLAVVGLLVLSLALAREPVVVAHPVTDAREQYLMSLATINAHSGVGAVMWARERGTVAGPSVRLIAREVPASATISIDESQALGLLSGAKKPSYSGTQRVWLLDGDQEHRANDVEINHVAGEGTSLTVLDADKQSSLTWFAPELGCCATALVDTAWSFAQYENSSVVAGRTSTVVEASLGDDVVARWWVDQHTGVLLWAERYTTNGDLTEVAGFTSIQYGNAQLATNSVGVASLETVVAVDSAGWCIGLQVCPLKLAGLPLVALSNSTNQQLLVYSDGVRMLSLTWTSGRLADATRVEDFTAGQPLVAAWQVDNGVLTVTTSSSPTLLDQACAELPGESPHRYGVFERIASGLGRLVGSS